MGKNAQKRRGDEQIQLDHFKLDGETYVNIRRYLGSRPHDETARLIAGLESLPAVTAPDVERLAKQHGRLMELEKLVESLNPMDELDAERYRWFKRHCYEENPENWPVVFDTPEDMDKKIDAQLFQVDKDESAGLTDPMKEPDPDGNGRVEIGDGVPEFSEVEQTADAEKVEN